MNSLQRDSGREIALIPTTGDMDTSRKEQDPELSSDTSTFGQAHDADGQDAGELPIEAADMEDKGLYIPAELRRTNVRGLHRIIFNFTPQWFLVTMGTGNVAIILFLIPFKAAWLYWLSVVVFALETLLFCVFCIISLIRYIMYPKLIPIILRHPMQAFYLGPFTVSFASITNLMADICVPAWGDWVINWVWAFWWINVLLALGVQIGIMFCLFRFHDNLRLDQMIATWLLPSISSIVASSCSGVVATVLPLDHALWTLTVGLVLWSCGVFLAMIILAQYFHRLTLSHLPPVQTVFTVFLPLGPLAQGAHGIMELGKVALTVWPATHTLPQAADAGQILYVMAWLIALSFWAFAIVWLMFAIATLIDRKRFPFNMTCWSLIFPTGVLALATMQIGDEMPSLFFQWLGTVFTAMNIVCWLAVCGLTARGIWNGSLFGNPKSGRKTA